MKPLGIRSFQRRMAAQRLPHETQPTLLPLKPAQIRAAWRAHRPSVVLRSDLTHAELLREGRGEV